MPDQGGHIRHRERNENQNLLVGRMLGGHIGALEPTKYLDEELDHVGIRLLLVRRLRRENAQHVRKRTGHEKTDVLVLVLQ